MTTCCICGRNKPCQNRPLKDEYPSPVCDECAWTVRAIRLDPGSEASLNNVAEMLGKHPSSPLIVKALIDLLSTENQGKIRELKSEVVMLAEDMARIEETIRKMPITSGHNFEGYRIVRYGGYVSGDEVAPIPMGFFTGSMRDDDVNEALKKVRNVAIQELKEAAANLDCNAVIGLDFDYVTIDRSGPQGTLEIKIILTANGTAVEIEPL